MSYSQPHPGVLHRIALGLAAVAIAAAAAATSADPEPAAESQPGPPAPVAAAADERIRLGTMLDDRPTLVDPTAHYTLYVPSGVSSEHPAPALLIFDPRGRARLAADLFKEAADRYGWILVSSNDTRSDTGSWEPNEKALRALWPELQRFPIDRERIYAAGFSGGAMVAWVLGQRSPGSLAGIIGAGGRLPEGVDADDPTFVHWGAAGGWDFNYDEMRHIDGLLARQDVPHWLEIFPGGHSWMPPELALQAVGWMELQAMRRGLRDADPAIVTALWDELAAGAEKHEAAGDLLAAWSRWQQMADSFAGLRDTAAATREMGRLEDDRRLAALRKEERKWDALDERFAAKEVPLLGLASAQPPLSASEISERLGLRRLLERAEGDDYPAVASQRMLERVYVQASFYLPNEYLARGLPGAARAMLEVALEIHPESPYVWYNLACARARLGAVAAALEALHAAIDRGFSQRELLLTDEDLESVRATEGFAELLARLPA